MSTQQAIHYVPNGEVLGIKLVETKNTHQSHPSASFQMSMWSLLTRGLVSPSPWRERERTTLEAQVHESSISSYHSFMVKS